MITTFGRGGTSQFVPIPKQVADRLGTEAGKTVRVTINVDLDSEED